MLHTRLASLPPSLPPSAAHSTCVLSYLLQPIIVPTYGVSSCKPQFRGSEILLSDCHNASASGEGRSLARPPPLPSSSSSSFLQSPGCIPPHPFSLSLTLSVFLAEMLHLCFHSVSLRRSVSSFLSFFYEVTHPAHSTSSLFHSLSLSPLCI